MQVRHKSATGAAVAIMLLACVAVTLVVNLSDDERNSLSQEEIMKEGVVGSAPEDADEDPIALAREAMLESQGILDGLPPDNSQDSAVAAPNAAASQSTEQLVQYAMKKAKRSASHEVTALVTKAAERGELEDYDQRIAQAKEQLQDLRGQIQAHASMLLQQGQNSDDFKAALKRAAEGKNVDADLQRAREYVQHEQGNIQDIQSWLSSARAQAQSAIDQHKDQIALHQHKLKDLRYILNRLQLESRVSRSLRAHAQGNGRQDSGDAAGYGEAESVSGEDESVSGGDGVQPAHSRMHAINDAVKYLHRVQPPTSRRQEARIRANIRHAVRQEVSSEARHLQTMNLSSKQEEEAMRNAIQAATVKAVADSVAQKIKATKPTLNPNHGKEYVTQEASEAAAQATAAALAAGQSDGQVRQTAVSAAKRASEVATRQVAQAVARAAALRAAQMAANAGQGQREQRVAAQVAARAAVKRIVKDNAALRYLNQRKTQAFAGTHDVGNHNNPLAIAARNAEQRSDVVEAGEEGLPPPRGLPTPPQGAQYMSMLGTGVATQESKEQSWSYFEPLRPGSDGTQGNAPQSAPQPPAPPGQTPTTSLPAVPRSNPAAAAVAVKAAAGGASPAGIAAKAAGAPAVAANPGTPLAVIPENPQDPVRQQIDLKAAQIRADAAAKRAQAAAQAAASAPAGPAGQKIIAKARLIAAEAARDIADARMKIMLARAGESPKPIIHQAASQAAQLVTPIATEVASQTATLQATQQAVAAAKKMLEDKSAAAARAASAADKIVHTADKALQQGVKAQVQKSVSAAVQAVVDEKVKAGASQEEIVAAAKAAAASEGHRMEDLLLRKQIKATSVDTAEAAATAAEQAGGDVQEVEGIRTQAVNTLRLDGEDTMREVQAQAEDDAAQTAAAASQASVQQITAAEDSQASTAKTAVDDAVKTLATGTADDAEASMKKAAEAVNAKQSLEDDTAATAADSAGGAPSAPDSELIDEGFMEGMLGLA